MCNTNIIDLTLYNINKEDNQLNYRKKNVFLDFRRKTWIVLQESENH